MLRYHIYLPPICHRSTTAAHQQSEWTRPRPQHTLIVPNSGLAYLLLDLLLLLEGLLQLGLQVADLEIREHSTKKRK